MHAAQSGLMHCAIVLKQLPIILLIDALLALAGRLPFEHHSTMVHQEVVCIHITQLNFMTAFPKNHDKTAKRDSSKGGKPSTAAIARHICEKYSHLLTPEDPEQRPMEFMMSRARLICEKPGFLKPFNAALVPTQYKKTRKVGTKIEEAALMESLIESIAQTFKNLKKFSENVPTITVVVPGVQPASMTEVDVLVCVAFLLCVLCFLCVCALFVVCVLCVCCVSCMHRDQHFGTHMLVS